MEISEEDKNLILSKYQDFYQMALKKKDKSSLSKDDLKAIGLKVFDDIIENVMNQNSLNEIQKKEFYELIKNLIIENSNMNLWDSKIIYDGKQLKEKF